MTGANGGSDVSQDIAKANPSDRIMDNWAVGKLIDWAAGKDGKPKTKESLKQELCEFASELAGPSPSPVERALAETAATAWFAYRLHEAQYAGAVTSEGGMSVAHSEHAQRRLDRAHPRLSCTLKAIASVRRLTLAAVQVNLARGRYTAPPRARA